MITAATSPSVLGKQTLHVRSVAGLGLERLEQQRLVDRVKEVDAADRHRADRVAVVGHPQRDELGAGPRPRWRQYWKAILSAISVAVEPESE